MTKDILRATVRYWVERRFRNEVSTERWPWRRNVFFCFLCTSLNLLYHKLYWRSCHCDRDTYPRSFDHKSVALPLAITELPPHPPRSTSAPSVHCRTQVVWGFVCACTGIVRNELICGYASVLHTSSSFRPHTHTHTHTFSYHLRTMFHDPDSRSTDTVYWYTCQSSVDYGTPQNNPACTKRVSQSS